MLVIICFIATFISDFIPCLCIFKHVTTDPMTGAVVTLFFFFKFAPMSYLIIGLRDKILVFVHSQMSTIISRFPPANWHTIKIMGDQMKIVTTVLGLPFVILKL